MNHEILCIAWTNFVRWWWLTRGCHPPVNDATVFNHWECYARGQWSYP